MTLTINKIRGLSLRTLVAGGLAIIVAVAGLGWMLGSLKAQPAGTLPPGAIPIAIEYMADYDKYLKDYQQGVELIKKSEAPLTQIYRLTLDKAKIPLDKFGDYKHDQQLKALVPLTAQEREQIQRQQQGR